MVLYTDYREPRSEALSYRKCPCTTESSALPRKAPDLWGEGWQRRLFGFTALIAFHAQRRRQQERSLLDSDCPAHATTILRFAATPVSSRPRTVSFSFSAAICCRLPHCPPGSKQATDTSNHLAPPPSSFVAFEN